MVVSRVPPLLPGLEYERIKGAWQDRPADADVTYKVVAVEAGES